MTKTKNTIKKMIDGRDKDLEALRRLATRLHEERDNLEAENTTLEGATIQYEDWTQAELEEYQEDLLHRYALLLSEANDLPTQIEEIEKIKARKKQYQQ